MVQLPFIIQEFGFQLSLIGLFIMSLVIFPFVNTYLNQKDSYYEVNLDVDFTQENIEL